MIVQIVQFESALTEEEALAVSKKRLPRYRAQPGLIQKHYLTKSGENRYSGVMIWESREALEAFRASDLAKTIPSAYKVVGAPDIQIYEMMFSLRDDAALPGKMWVA